MAAVSARAISVRGTANGTAVSLCDLLRSTPGPLLLVPFKLFFPSDLSSAFSLLLARGLGSRAWGSLW